MQAPTSVTSSSVVPDGGLRFRHVAIIGKYQALGSRDALDNLAHLLHAQGCEVALERETALNTGLTQHQSLSVNEIGERCDLASISGSPLPHWSRRRRTTTPSARLSRASS